MSTHVIGFKPPDETWKKHKAVWDACEAAGLPDDQWPEDTLKFFDHETPDAQGVECELPLEEWSSDHEEGYQLELAKVPKGVTIIRFCNSW